MTTNDIDRLVHEKIIANNAYPSPLHYMGFPKSVCTSINNVACHGIPDDRPLEDGDIINIDITVCTNLEKHFYTMRYIYFAVRYIFTDTMETALRPT
jgi:methionine aminopeptidase